MIHKTIYKICFFIASAFAFCNAADYPDEKSDDDPIFAYFCFYKDVVSWIKQDSVYALSYYEMQNELTISVDYKSTTNSSIFGAHLLELDQEKIQTDLMRGVEGGRCMVRGTICIKDGGVRKYPGAKCAGNRRVAPYDLIDFYILQKDSLYIKSLFGTTNRLKWEYLLDMGKQKQKISGDNIIYISGFCTEEQLKAIRERKKNIK